MAPDARAAAPLPRAFRPGALRVNVLLCSSFLHPRGGDTTCVYAMWHGLEARGHTVAPFAMRHPANLPSPWEVRFPPQLDVWSVRGVARLAAVAASIHSFAAARAMTALLADHRPDVAHLHHVHRHLTPSILEPLRKAGVPVVWTVHDYELICANGQLYTQGAPCTRCKGHAYDNAVRYRCKRDDLAQSAAVALEKWVHARMGLWTRVDRFLCPSRFLAEQLVAFGVPADRVTHLPNPVLPAPAGGPIGDHWLYAGRLSPEKGVDDLLDAARRLPARLLHVYGDGPERARLERTAPPNVRFFGNVPPLRLAAALREAGVVAVPSRWPENFPYAVLEGQLAGRAVVASAVGGIPEQIDDGVDGVLVPPSTPARLADAVEALLSDRAHAARLGARGRERVLRDRAVDPFITRLEAIYRHPSDHVVV
ncbi:MAG: glycosyltransferase family 4 protein [Pseudomonadota bacterium]|nr:glycosyltransferase family 4 protein [Pseudomonadota bacterium]